MPAYRINFLGDLKLADIDPGAQHRLCLVPASCQPGLK
ncbi:hypothetical protein L611_002200000670 [Aminobacter sp. J15]|nr:hypothetical protein L610_005300000010 [Aminobacter sp. J44]TWH31976.1 hypothetical protein L611_002200000670 [Aminobacter sp. J15]